MTLNKLKKHGETFFYLSQVHFKANPSSVNVYGNIFSTFFQQVLLAFQMLLTKVCKVILNKPSTLAC